MTYKHTQPGYLMILVLSIVTIYLGFLISILDYSNNIIASMLLMVLIIVIIASFVTLNVSVNKKQIKIKFGYGLFYKRFPIKQIKSVKKVKNHWYYGWGIKFWPKPRMWIYSVSGLSAVEINMKNDKIYRIGTDDQDKLYQEIKNMIK